LTLHNKNNRFYEGKCRCGKQYRLRKGVLEEYVPEIAIRTSLFDDNGATFSDDRKYRFVLWRMWDKQKPMIMFIGLNPSTANEYNDDPTIRRVVRFANTCGVYMLNLFTYVTAYPAELMKCPERAYQADMHLQLYNAASDTVIFAWGSFPEAAERVRVVIEMFPNGKVLGINKNGSPKHPLYIKGDTIAVNYK